IQTSVCTRLPKLWPAWQEQKSHASCACFRGIRDRVGLLIALIDPFDFAQGRLSIASTVPACHAEALAKVGEPPPPYLSLRTICGCRSPRRHKLAAAFSRELANL